MLTNLWTFYSFGCLAVLSTLGWTLCSPNSKTLNYPTIYKKFRFEPFLERKYWHVEENVLTVTCINVVICGWYHFLMSLWYNFNLTNICWRTELLSGCTSGLLRLSCCVKRCFHFRWIIQPKLFKLLRLRFCFPLVKK